MNIRYFNRDRKYVTVSIEKIHRGVYKYRNFRISNCGYHQPDHAIWWEAVNDDTGCADYHAHTLRDIIAMIDRFENVQDQKGIIKHE